LIDDTTSWHIRAIYLSLILMAVVVVGSSLFELRKAEQAPNEDPGTNVMVGILLVFIWLGPIYAQLFLPRRSQLTLTSSAYDEVPNVEEDEEDVPDCSSGSVQADYVHLSDTEDDQLYQESEVKEYKLGQMLMTATAWLLFWTTMILVGAGIMELNNMGQMTESLGFPGVTTSVSLSFFSVAQAFGRVITGAVSESALDWKTSRFGIRSGIPRPFFLTVAAGACFVANLIMGLARSRAPFIIGATISGLAFGMVWPLMVLIISEVFGTENAGANYLFFDGSTSAFGALLLAKYVAQEVYDDHIDPNLDPEGRTCYGIACFQMTHMICAILSCVCMATSIAMIYVTRDIYNSDHVHKMSSH